eukprot:4605554-Alexandrium_andersonii.AAC.1
MSMCAYGVPFRKGTSIFHVNFAALAEQLQCCPGGHARQVLQGSLATAAAEYPQQFCEQYARCAPQQCKHTQQLHPAD